MKELVPISNYVLGNYVRHCSKRALARVGKTGYSSKHPSHPKQKTQHIFLEKKQNVIDELKL